MIATPSERASVTSFASAPEPAGSSSESSTLTVASFDGPGGGADETEAHGRYERRVAPYLTREEREGEREKEREDEPARGAERTADEISGLGRTDPPDDDRGRKHRDVRRSEPAQDGAGRREKKDDEDLVAERRDLCDLEQRGAEEEAEDEADEGCNETDESHEGRSFLM